MKNNATTNATMKNVIDVYNVFSKYVMKYKKITKINFSDAKTQPYCGLNNFSVNFKKRSYNVYMNETNANICKTLYDDLTVLENDCDTTKKQLRNRLIIFTVDEYDKLVNCIEKVINA